MRSSASSNPATIDLLAAKFSEFSAVKCASSRKNQILRAFDMLFVYFRQRSEAQALVVDTYSGWGFYYALVFCFLSRLSNIQFIPILHGGSLPERDLRNPKLVKYLLQRSNHVVSPSKYLQNWATLLGYSCDYIPNFIEIKNYLYKHRGNPGPRLLWVRAFHEVYNPQMAVDILAGLLIKYSNAQLCMIGPDKDGSLVEVLEYAKELGVQEHLTTPGGMTKKEWCRLSREYDIFINTTNVDNMPVSVIEAMALGLPIVSTDVGGMPFLINDQENGLLSPAGDFDAMSMNVIKLLDDQELFNRLAYAGRKVAEEFSWQKVAPKWRQILT